MHDRSSADLIHVAFLNFSQLTLDTLTGDFILQVTLESPSLESAFHLALQFLDHHLSHKSLGRDAVLEVVALLQFVSEEIFTQVVLLVAISE